MSKNKSDVLADFIERKVCEAIDGDIAIYVRQEPQLAQQLQRVKRSIEVGVSRRIVRDWYGRKELEDILAWRIQRDHWND